MDTLSLVLVFLPIGLMGIMALSANRSYRAHDRLPMQWTFAGDVSWSAPRAVALFFLPAMAAVFLGVMAWLTADVAQDIRWMMLGITAAAFVAVHVLHLRLLRARVS